MSLLQRFPIYRNSSENTAKWLSSKWGRRFRFGLIAGTVVTYPAITLLVNGPFLNYTFPRRHCTDYDLPDHLRNIIDEQYKHFLRTERRDEKNAVVTFSCSSDHACMDTVAEGSLSVRYGAQISLPFYARFKTIEEVFSYCKEKLQPLYFFGEPACVIWDSDTGREIAETFLLSDKELKFLILRDLNAHDGNAAFTRRATSWATFTTFSGAFAYWIHSQRRFKGSILAFILIFSFCTALGRFGAKEWYRLYRFMADIHADGVSSHTSFDHGEGGKEYYWKMLKRNRMLKEMIPNGTSYVAASGDLRKITTRIITRYDHLKDVNAEDDELREVVKMDD